MTQIRKNTLICFLAGSLFSLLVILIVLTGLSGNVYVTDPEGIPAAADHILQIIQTGDWTAFETTVYGITELVPDIGEAESAQRLIYEAYQESLRWTIGESFAIQGPYVTQTVTVNCLDIPEATKSMAEVLEKLSGTTAADQKQLFSAANQVLASDPPVIQREVTLTFLREHGRWQVIPNSAFLALVSGFTAH